MEYNELYNGNPIPDIHAKMYLVPYEDGGRKTPFFKGYNPTFYRIETQYSAHDVSIYFLDRRKEMGTGGETIDIYLYFFQPIFQIGNLFEGLNFYLKEGGRVVATATITKVLKPEMFYWYPEILINSLKERSLKSIHEITKTNLRKEFNKLPFMLDVDYSSQNKNKETIFDLNFSGFYDKKQYLTNLAKSLFEFWQEKFNLGEEKHKFYYLREEKLRQVVFEFVTWNDKNYLSCRLLLEER